jgi:hypothetical protein
VSALLGDLARPAIVPVQGKITFQGQPLRNAQIISRPVAGRGLGGFGWTDNEGNITVTTDIRGVRTDGMTVGQHKLAVSAYGSSPGASAPPLLTPEQYASLSTTPLQITVESDAAANHFDLQLDGEPASQPSAAAGGKQGKKGKKGAAGGKQGPMRQPRPPGVKTDDRPDDPPGAVTPPSVDATPPADESAPPPSSDEATRSGDPATPSGDPATPSDDAQPPKD